MTPNNIENISSEEIKSLVLKLRNTIVWTNILSNDFDFEKGNFGTVFRQTNPKITGENFYRIEGKYSFWEIDDYSTENYEKALDLLCKIRKERISKVCSSDIDKKGRILVFLTQVSTHDGVPAYESKGFVDEGDVSPIDTWFFLKDKFYGHGYAYSDVALLCWIPEKFEQYMQAAIDVEILDSYDWLDELNPTLNKQIMNSL